MPKQRPTRRQRVTGVTRAVTPQPLLRAAHGRPPDTAKLKTRPRVHRFFLAASAGTSREATEAAKKSGDRRPVKISAHVSSGRCTRWDSRRSAGNSLGALPALPGLPERSCTTCAELGLRAGVLWQ
jgi:hypothetical protein